MSHEPNEAKVATLTIDTFRPEDAEDIAELFRAVYGDGYPIKVYYQPDALRQAFARDEIIPAVARDPHGKVVGLVNLYRSAPWPGVYESGAGLVSPDYRIGGLFRDICRHLYEKVAPHKPVALIFGEAVCIHLYSQRMQSHLGFVPVALEVDLMPAETYQTTFDPKRLPKGRVACMIDVKTLKPRPHTVYLPPVYRGVLQEIYDRLDDQRTLQPADQKIPADRETKLHCRFFDHAGVLRIAVHQIGHDLTAKVQEELQRHREKGGQVFQLWLPLDQPWIGDAVDRLRQEGFFFGGLLPRWFDHDGMLMMRMDHTPHWEGIKLYRREMHELMEVVRNDWQQVAG